jgi:hypothetical protein
MLLAADEMKAALLGDPNKAEMKDLLLELRRMVESPEGVGILFTFGIVIPARTC